jgi:hypothetical protein
LGALALCFGGVVADDEALGRGPALPTRGSGHAYSEAQFKTLKYRPGFPQRFDSIEHARTFCRDFFARYNTLCRRRHKWFYADVRVMPTWGRDRAVGAVIAALGSA